MQKKFGLYTVISVLPVIQNCVTGSYNLIYAEFLGAFRRVSKSDLVPSCQSVRRSAWKTSAPTCQIFIKFYI